MAKATRWFALGLILCIAAQTAQAKSYVVGDELGWTFSNDSSGLPVDYQAWADGITFMKDDVLVFNYTVDQQNLYIFDTYEAWLACNFSRGYMLDNGTAGNSEWILTTEGHYEFASAMFCHQEQKFSLYAIDPQLLITQVTSDESVPPPASSPESPQAPLSSNVTTAPPVPPLKSAPPPSASAPMIMTQVLMVVVACATISVMHSF